MKQIVVLILLAALALLPAAAIAAGELGEPAAAAPAPWWQQLIVACSPIIVGVLGVLLGNAKREINRRLTEANIQADALHALALAIERASERGPEDVANSAESIKAHTRRMLERQPAAAAVVHAAAKSAELQVQEEVEPPAVVLPMHPVP